MKLNIEQIQNIVKCAVQTFLEEKPNLLDLDVHEQSISHRIAVYLEKILEKYNLNIDCEYSKNLDDVKRGNIGSYLVISNCVLCDCGACKKITNSSLAKLKNKHFRPDILVHSRGTNNKNIVAVEIKKTQNCPFDEAKLKSLTDHLGEYKYEIGVSIFFCDKSPYYKWFYNGKVFNLDT